MLFIPFPFVVAIFLVVLFASVARRDNDASANYPFLALVLVGALLSCLSGMRWGYGIEQVGYVAPVVAATVPPLAYLGVAMLVGKSGLPKAVRLGLHAIPAAVVLVLMLSWPAAIDVVLALIFVGYAVAILFFIRRGSDTLRLAPFDGVDRAYRAILFTAFALLLSAAVDTFVFFDLGWADGEYAVSVITGANLITLGILCVAAASASRSHAPAELADTNRAAKVSEPDTDPEVAESGPGPADTATFAAVQALMDGKRIYRDMELNLNRLARKLGIPSRQVSTAINRATGKNVSQYVNEYRISEACVALTATEKPVTEIMFEVGFQTKSNFNREFRRVTEMTPLEWRERKGNTS